MEVFRDEDTIAAISTPLGPGGIGIIRVSGPDSLGILKALFRPVNPDATFDSHRMYYGHIHDPATGEMVDEALCVYMKGPKTYTREDIVEIQCHGGPAVMARILDLCLAQGARAAEPGEFTKRAFLNGRIDLAQAEALMDIIEAQATGLSRLGAKALEGGLSRRLQSIRSELIYCLSALEVAIDYPEEDQEIVEEEDILSRLTTGVMQPIQELLEAYDATKIQRFGAKVLLVGRPNAGKSSLLNALACEDKAIVTDIPGTTRDIVEKQIDVQGIAVVLLDTAGIRHSPDPIEALGIEKIKDIAQEASLFLWVIDLLNGLGPEDHAVMELLARYSTIPLVVVFNKSDLFDTDPDKRAHEILERISLELGLGSEEIDWCCVSAKTHQGLTRLLSLMAKRLLGTSASTQVGIAPNMRQKHLLEGCLDLINQALEALRAGMSPEIPAFNLRQALDRLGQITGETATEEILDQIFSNFCLGK